MPAVFLLCIFISLFFFTLWISYDINFNFLLLNTQIIALDVFKIYLYSLNISSTFSLAVMSRNTFNDFYDIKSLKYSYVYKQVQSRDALCRKCHRLGMISLNGQKILNPRRVLLSTHIKCNFINNLYRMGEQHIAIFQYYAY